MACRAHQDLVRGTLAVSGRGASNASPDPLQPRVSRPVCRTPHRCQSKTRAGRQEPLQRALDDADQLLGTLLIFFILKGDGDRVQNARLDMATKSLDLRNQLRQILARDIATVVAETDLAEGGS
jgi:hypothetical protein